MQHPPDLCLRAHALQHWDSGLHLLFALPTKKALVVQGTQATPPSTVFSSQNRRAKLLPRDSAKCQRSSGRLPVQRLWAACRHVVMSLHLLSHGQSDWSAASHPKSGAAAPGTTIKALHRPATRPAGVCLHHLRSADGRAQDVHTCRVPSAQPVCRPADARVSHRGPQVQGRSPMVPEVGPACSAIDCGWLCSARGSTHLHTAAGVLSQHSGAGQGPGSIGFLARSRQQGVVPPAACTPRGAGAAGYSTTGGTTVRDD